MTDPAEPSPRATWRTKALVLFLSVDLALAMSYFAWEPLKRWTRPWRYTVEEVLPELPFGEEDAAPPPLVVETAYLRGASLPDPTLAYVFAPHTLLRSYYPSNPRGYFHVDDSAAWSILRKWHLRQQEATQAEAKLTNVEGTEAIEVVLGPLPEKLDPWVITLQADSLRLRRTATLSLRLRARAEVARPIELVIMAKETKPESLVRQEIALGPEWTEWSEEFSFPEFGRTLTVSPVLNLAGAGATLWISELTAEVLDAEPPPPAAATTTTSDGQPAAEPPDYRYYVAQEINGQGFRDREFVQEKLAETLRIACLGDSFTYGTGVHVGDRFSDRLAGALEASRPTGVAQPGYEVLNFALPVYGIREERLQYENVVADYHPDLVLLTLCWNDHVSAQTERELGARHARDADSRAYLNEMRRRYDEGDFTECREHLRALKAACDARGSKLAAMIFNLNKHDGWERLIAEVTPELTALGVPLLVLGPHLQEAGIWAETAYAHPIDHHPNAEAHRLAAERLAEFLRAEKLVD